MRHSIESARHRIREIGLDKPINQVTKKFEAVDSATTARFSLVIYHRGGSSIQPLRPDKPVVIGREALISIPDQSLSRQHARFELIDDGVWLEDLCSTNGTRKNGELIEANRRMLVREGDVVSVGTVAISVHELFSTTRHYRLDSHEQFMRDLEGEIVRARAFKRTLAVALIRPSGERLPLSGFCPQLRQLVRPVDRMAWYAPDTVEVLLPEVELAVMEQLATTITSGSLPLRCGVAFFGEGGTTADELLESCRTALEQTKSDHPWRSMSRARRAGVRSTSQLIGQSEAMRRVIADVRRLASARAPVMLHGETGTGKEVLARYIHQLGRPRKPFISVNCGALPDDLVESTLFGTVSGAFTGAMDRKGAFEEADGGTLLLDEIGELPARQQVKLLRALETMTITRVGASKETSVDVRVIAATHRDLERLTREGEFREDLFYRLQTFPVLIPPLRARRGDIATLADHFIQRANEVNRCNVKGLEQQASELLMRHEWRGNVRELRNVIERAVVIAQSPTIQVSDLPDAIQQQGERGTATTGLNGSVREELFDEAESFNARVAAFQRELIRDALERCGWNQTHAAKLLKMSLRTLVYKIKAYDLKR